MPTTVLKSKARAKVPRFGPRSAGTPMRPAEFDRLAQVGDFAEGYRYEIVDGVLIVSPKPLPPERGGNELLGYWLLDHQQHHPLGKELNGTLPEQTVHTPMSRRVADRAIWAGLGRKPNWMTETPNIIAEFVSSGKRNQRRDYEEKRDDYMAMNVKEYWVIDRFQRIMTVFTNAGGKIKSKVIRDKQIYTTPLLLGFELPLAKLLAAIDDYGSEREEDD